MQSNPSYKMGHLVVAGIRVFEHLNGESPSVKELCEALSISLEQGNVVCTQLDRLGIVELVAGPYGNRLSVKDHLRLEALHKEPNGKQYGCRPDCPPPSHDSPAIPNIPETPGRRHEPVGSL